MNRSTQQQNILAVGNYQFGKIKIIDEVETRAPRMIRNKPNEIIWNIKNRFDTRD